MYVCTKFQKGRPLKLGVKSTFICLLGEILVAYLRLEYLPWIGSQIAE